MNYTIEQLDLMEGHDFEYAIAELLRYNGWRDVEVTQGSGDYGIDILARRMNVRYAIQCKRYNNSVGIGAVQEAAAGMDYYHCDAAAVITNNTFTKQAVSMAKTTGVRLWDREFLIKLIQNYDDGYDEIYGQESLTNIDITHADTSKVCPSCGRKFLSGSVRCPICECELVYISAQKGRNTLHPKSALQQDGKPRLTQTRSQPNSPSPNKTVKSKNNTPNKSSKLSVAALIFSCLGFTWVIGAVLAIIDLTQKDGRKKKLSVISLIIACLWISIISSITGKESYTASNNINSAVNDYDSAQVTVPSPDVAKELSMEERLWNSIIENISVIDEEELVEIRYIPEDNFTSITFMASTSFTTNLTIKATHVTISEILKTIQPIIDTNVEICVKCSVVDVYGNPSVANVIIADYSLDTIQKINFENFNPFNSPGIADSWWNHSLFELE